MPTSLARDRRSTLLPADCPAERHGSWLASADRGISRGRVGAGQGLVDDTEIQMPAYTPILATLGYVMSPDGARVLLIHRNTRPDDIHYGKYNGLGGKLDSGEDVVSGMQREIREEAGI